MDYFSTQNFLQRGFSNRLSPGNLGKLHQPILKGNMVLVYTLVMDKGNTVFTSKH